MIFSRTGLAEVFINLALKIDKAYYDEDIYPCSHPDLEHRFKGQRRTIRFLLKRPGAIEEMNKRGEIKKRN